MEGKTSTPAYCSFIVVISVLFFINGKCQQFHDKSIVSEYVFPLEDIFQIVENSCFLGFDLDHISAGTGGENRLQNIYRELNTAFAKEENVVTGIIDLKDSIWSSGNNLKLGGDEEIVLFPRRIRDRTCLSTGRLATKEPQMLTYNGIQSSNVIVEFVNQNCDTYRVKSGYLSVEGLHREMILNSLFHVENVTDINVNHLIHQSSLSYCSKQSCSFDSNKKLGGSSDTSEKSKSDLFNFKDSEFGIYKCDRIPLPSKDDFFHNYLKVSKPVIIKDAINHWPALRKWTNEYFEKNFGEQKVHIKLTPLGEFEGVDFASSFENYQHFRIPPDVIEQLPFPDLVVVRPATANMNFSHFIETIESVSRGERKGFSAYLEYSSIADIMPELEDDVSEMQFFKNLLQLKHLNIWLSDGNTLGKLHFDPFDNFLCQISGRKQVILFDPHENRRLYEAHIPEALLSYNDTTKTFSKKELVDSTSMVMSPVDILNPDLERFPLFGDAHPMNCTIDEGEVLFMPAFWWHEVQSYPNKEQGRNLAVNFWYEPFLQKEFPCQECKLHVNPKYRHLL